MFRSPRGTRLGAALAVAFAAGAGAADTAAQQDGATAEVRDLTLPVLDLELETSSLDRSVRRVEDSGDVRVTLAADVLFEFNRARLSPRTDQRIERAADEIRRADAESVTIVGHTDSKGSESYNLALSRRRAEAVRAALERSLAGSAPRLVTSGRGESRPIASDTEPDGSDSPAGRARNRRVEIRIPKS